MIPAADNPQHASTKLERRIARRGALVMLLCASTALLAAPSARAEEWPLLPLPADAHSAPLAQRLKVNGVTLRALQFHMTASEVAATQLFQKGCRDLGGMPTDNRLREGHVQGCVRPPYSMTAQWHQEGQKIFGTISTLRLDEKPQRSPLPEDMSLPPLTTLEEDMESEDGPVHGRVLRLSSTLGPQSIRNYFVGHLEAQGWRALLPTRPEGPALSFDKGRAHLDMVIGRAGVGSQMVLVWDYR